MQIASPYLVQVALLRPFKSVCLSGTNDVQGRLYTRQQKISRARFALTQRAHRQERMRKGACQTSSPRPLHSTALGRAGRPAPGAPGSLLLCCCAAVGAVQVAAGNSAAFVAGIRFCSSCFPVQVCTTTIPRQTMCFISERTTQRVGLEGALTPNKGVESFQQERDKGLGNDILQRYIFVYIRQILALTSRWSYCTINDASTATHHG